MFAITIALHVIISILLILVVLLQSSKGAGLAGAFGGGGAMGGSMGAVFGGRGAAPFLSKATTVLAIAFMLSCIIQLRLSPTAGPSVQRSVIQQEAEERARTQPAEALPVISDEPVPAGEGAPTEAPVEGAETEAQPAAVTDTTQ